MRARNMKSSYLLDDDEDVENDSILLPNLLVNVKTRVETCCPVKAHEGPLQLSIDWLSQPVGQEAESCSIMVKGFHHASYRLNN